MNSQYIKHCRSKSAYSNELFVYSSAFPYRASLISVQPDNTLILAKLDGIPYLDVPQLNTQQVVCLAQAISALHALKSVNAMVWCHWDNQPRNIFWCEARQQIYLLDFEDCRLAYPEADLAHLFLFWAEQMPHTVFTSCIYCFLQTYTASFPLASHRWQTEVRKARRRFLARRRKYNKKEPLSNPDRSANLQYLLRLDL